MAFGPSVNTVTVTGEYVDYQGNAIAGQVKFQLRALQRVPDDNQIIVPSILNATLDSNGNFSISLPATDDPDLLPSEFVYAVEESFAGGKSYTLSLPAANSPVDIADIRPPDDYEEFISLVNAVQWGQLEDQVDTLDEVVDQTNDTLVFTNPVYSNFRIAYQSYTQVNSAYADYQAIVDENNLQVTVSDLEAILVIFENFETAAVLSLTEAEETFANAFVPFFSVGG
jgi:hypothetical protein